MLPRKMRRMDNRPIFWFHFHEWVPCHLYAVKQDGGLLRGCLEIVRLKRLQFLGALPTLVTNVSDFNSCWLYFVPPQPTAPVLGLRECRGWPRNIWRIWLHHFNRYIYHIAVQTLVGLGNLVPRSLVDEAEGEIWQSKKIFFSWLAAPFDSCPIPFLKVYAVFRG